MGPPCVMMWGLTTTTKGEKMNADRDRSEEPKACKGWERGLCAGCATCDRDKTEPPAVISAPTGCPPWEHDVSLCGKYVQTKPPMRREVTADLVDLGIK